MAATALPNWATTAREETMGEGNGHIWPYADSYAFMEKVRKGMPPVIICLASNGGI